MRVFAGRKYIPVERHVGLQVAVERDTLQDFSLRLQY